MADKPPSFAIRPEDPKDVAWGLKTAETCWRRGERSEALKWLRRAVEAASEAEEDTRALELAKVAADLATQIASVAPPPPVASAGSAPPVVGGVAPRASPVAAQAVAARVPAAKDAPKKADRRSTTNEASRARPAEGQAGRGADRAQAHSPEPLPSHRKRAASRAERTEVQRRPDRTDEIDAWPTEVLAGDALPPGLRAESTNTHTAVSPRPTDRVRASQAVRVLLWRAPDGLVHVTARDGAKESPAHAVEATLVAVDPGADLVGILGAAR
jgi:hypothetical protein